MTHTHTNTILKELKAKGITQLFAYSRKSRDVDGEGLQKHHDIIKELADDLGMTVKFYEEVGSSERLDRPQLVQLRKDIKDEKVRGLVVYRLDRLSRKVTDTERLLKEFSFHDVVLIEAHRHKVIDYKETLGLKMEAMMSDLYQEQAKMVLQAGRQKAVAMYGNHLGVAPLGYTYNRDTKKLDPNDDAWIVRKIFDLYLEGFPCKEIAVKMNQLGVKTGRGGNFIPSTIYRMLKNRKFAGCQLYGQKEYFKDADGVIRTKDKPEEEWMVYENAHEPIIPPEKFQRVQELMDRNRKRPLASRRRKFALTGLCKCGVCGRNMTFSRAGVGTYKNDYVRSCFKLLDVTTGEYCRNKGILGETAEWFIVDKIFTEVRPYILRAELERSKENAGKFGEGSQDSVIQTELIKRRGELERQIDNAMDLQIDLGKSDRLTNKIKTLQAQVKELDKEISKVDSANSSETVVQWVHNFLSETVEISSFIYEYKGWEHEKRNRFYSKYVDYITIVDGVITGIKYTPDVERLRGLLDS